MKHLLHFYNHTYIDTYKDIYRLQFYSSPQNMRCGCNQLEKEKFFNLFFFEFKLSIFIFDDKNIANKLFPWTRHNAVKFHNFL